MIPNFVHRPDAPGPLALLLPQGLHPCTLAEVEQRMAENFTTSRTRRSIFSGLQFYLRDCQALGVGGRIWLDGSFVTGKNNPADIDVISLVSSDFLNRLSVDEQTELLRLLNGGESTKARYDVHSFGALALQKTDVDYLDNARKIRDGLRYFGQTKRFIGREGELRQLLKGLLQLDFGDATQVEKVSRWFSMIQSETTSWN